MQDTQGQELPQGVAEEKQPVELPATEPKQDGQVDAQQSQQPAQAEGLPEDASERTREQFEKLTARNRELAQKLSQYEGTKKKPTIFDFSPQMQQPAVVQQQTVEQQNEISPIVPDAEGYVDVNKINETLNQLRIEKDRALKEAQEAKRLAQEVKENVSRSEIKQTSQLVFQKHPELDPDNTDFDEKFTELVKLELLRQMTEEGTQDYLRAADHIRNNLYSPNKKSEQKKEEIQKAQQARSEINALASSSQSQSSEDELIARSRKGDRDAIYERLMRSGH